MGSPESGAAAVDCSIGSIVWVRRRNGSWWPGKILGPDELSASHVMSPRSGTPVKLLGREDASVDWYNLEKSKRVKAFRCGEFDDCIERAEASQGMPPKKREKYARREDAILHALELERQMLEKKCGKEGHSNGKSSKPVHGVKKEMVSSSEKTETENRKLSQPKQLQDNISFPLKDKSEDHDLRLGAVKEGNQPSADDDNSGTLPRMRGLQDFGLGTAATVPSNVRTSPSAPSNGAHKLTSDSSCHSILDVGLNTEVTVDGNYENSGKVLHENLCEDSLAKRRNRRRPLVQVLQDSSKLPVSVSHSNGSMSEEEQTGVSFPAKRSRYNYLTSESPDTLFDTKIHATQMETLPAKFEGSNSRQPAGSFEENTIGSTEDTETDSCETDSLESDSDDLASLSEGAASIELQPKYPGQSGARQEYGNVSGEEVDDSAFTDEMSQPFQNDLASTGGGVSRWQLKGKRNSRNLLKRPPEGTSRNFLRAYADETAAAKSGTKRRGETYLLEKNFKPRMGMYGFKGPDDVACGTMQWEHSDWNDQPTNKGCWEDSTEYFNPAFVSHPRNSGKIMLIDVDVKVQSSYQREHVPMISLMSKINGQAIVGHPIQVETLENGSSEALVAETDDWYPEMLENDATLPPVWKTARRTANIRFPRPDLLSAYDDSGRHPQIPDSRKGVSSGGKSNYGTSFGYKASTSGKQHIVGQVPVVDRKSSRKPLKKISLSSNQKIRTLSSISSQQKQSNEHNVSGSNYRVEGLLKPESVPTTAVACIPVKLVFSRLQEELIGRHA